MPDENLLGEYLRARRELVRPEDVGIAERARRRVSGLRREEVALLAGVSADYYVRLEQGRDRHPSSSVLDALARALRLDEGGVAHLHRLARGQRAASEEPERVPAGIRQLLSWIPVPAYVYGRYMDVLAANAQATALQPVVVEGVNLVRTVFLETKRLQVRQSREVLMETTAARLRSLAGADTSDRRLAAIVEELSVDSEQFRTVWARHDCRLPNDRYILELDNDQVGELVLTLERLAIPDADRQFLVLHHAEPHSRSADALRTLAASTARSNDGALAAYGDVDQRLSRFT